MFNDIGKKIMVLSKIVCYIGCAISVIFGIIVFIWSFSWSGNPAMGILGLLLGIVCAGLGIIASWLGVLVLYGFGELIDNTNTIISQNSVLQKSVSNIKAYIAAQQKNNPKE